MTGFRSSYNTFIAVPAGVAFKSRTNARGSGRSFSLPGLSSACEMLYCQFLGILYIDMAVFILKNGSMVLVYDSYG